MSIHPTRAYGKEIKEYNTNTPSNGPYAHAQQQESALLCTYSFIETKARLSRRTQQENQTK